MRQSIQRLEDQILETCSKNGRKRDEVKLVAVSKTKPIYLIEEAYAAGLRIFAESRAQEFRDKVNSLYADIEWHFIGHLQRNKIKYVATSSALIHSVDTLMLAEALSDYATTKAIEVPILLEVNTSAEPAKFGVHPDQAQEVYLRVQQLPGLKLKGLMTIAPFVSEEKQIRKSFSDLRKLKDQIMAHLTDQSNFELSMGMSQDFQWAIAEGSTIIRVGTALFGAREAF